VSVTAAVRGRWGTLILETAFGLFDERCFYNPIVPPWGLADVFGYREMENFTLQPKGERGPLADTLGPAVLPQAEQIYYEPQIEFSEPVPVDVKAHTFVTPIQITSARAIATCQGFTVAAKKRVGKGQVFYVGTNLGATIAAGSETGIEWLRGIVTAVVQPRISAKRLRPRLIQGSKGSLLVIFNDSSTDATENIALSPRYGRATDIHSGKEQPVENQSVTVTVPYEDAVLLLLV
jgi:hypothetical protein